MARAHSPLRYPGGKSCLDPLVSRLLKDNKLQRCHYAEPYAGGCGLALSLLFAGQVSNIHINDVDASIWCFWKSVLDHTDKFIDLIETTDVTIDEWLRQREIQAEGDSKDIVGLGFATFFLNRTNRSGIIKGAGVIGGMKQEGNYKIDCRFNKEELVRRVSRIKKYRAQINLEKMDALDFISSYCENLPERSFICIDPPYFKKGSSLYTSFYQEDDHAAVSDTIMKSTKPWIVTYDDCEHIRNLYKARRQFVFDINYSVQTKRVGTELFIPSKGLRVPQEIRDRQVHRVQYRVA